MLQIVPVVVMLEMALLLLLTLLLLGVAGTYNDDDDEMKERMVLTSRMTGLTKISSYSPACLLLFLSVSLSLSLASARNMTEYMTMLVRKSREI